MQELLARYPKIYRLDPVWLDNFERCKGHLNLLKKAPKRKSVSKSKKEYKEYLKKVNRRSNNPKSEESIYPYQETNLNLDKRKGSI